MESLLEKGNYQPINLKKHKEIINAFEVLDNVIGDKEDFDKFLSQIKDQQVSILLGFNLINESKHGLDAKSDSKYLECKQTSVSAKQNSAVFNDTNIDKAYIFKQEEVIIALSVSRRLASVAFVVYGSDPKIGSFLEKRIIEQTEKSMRRTQNITLSKLIKDYGFKIKLGDMNKDEVLDYLNTKYPRTFKNFDLEKIIE